MAQCMIQALRAETRSIHQEGRTMIQPTYLTIHDVFRDGQRIGEIHARWAGHFVGEPVHNLTGIPEGGVLIECTAVGIDDEIENEEARFHFMEGGTDPREPSEALRFVPPINPGFDIAY